MSAKSKSLLLTLEFPPDIGGIANYYHQIVKSGESIQVLHLKTSGCRLSWLKCFWPTARQIKKNKIDCLQIGQILPLGYLGLFFKLTCRRPYAVYAHGLDILHNSLSIWKKFWIKVILQEADIIITNSNYVKERVLKKYNINIKKFKVVYPRIDLTNIESATEKLTRLDLPKDVKIILSVGRLVERKGFDMVIEALDVIARSDKGATKQSKTEIASATPRNDKWQYWIVGDGQDRGRLESLVKKYNLESKVKFLGAVPSLQIYQYYKACDVFIMPCREIDGDVEGFGIVFLEAAAFKKPSIAGKSGGAPEAVVDGITGLLVDPMDVEEISQALLKLLTNDEVSAKLGQNAYERVRREFSV